MESTLRQLEANIGKDQADIDSVFIWLEKYIRAVYINPDLNKKGDDIKIALDAVFNSAITLFKLIDKGATGLDDALADNLTKIKIQYLGS